MRGKGLKKSIILGLAILATVQFTSCTEKPKDKDSNVNTQSEETVKETVTNSL